MSALKEIVDRYEEHVREEHRERACGDDIERCIDCAADLDLISRARAELEWGVDVRRALMDFEGWELPMTDAVRDMERCLRAQGVRVVEEGKESSDGK